MDDVIELHFTLGLWIRNNWIYEQSEEEIMALMKSLEGDEEALFYHPDEYSSIILEAYKKHLISQ